ncbi:MAG: GPR endopeptidase, partial [Firmicutes bacterium]|nr:GPR endopeptidase [Bacillota bacterium]
VPGRYVTLEIPDLPTRNPELTNQASDILSRVLHNLDQLQPDQTVMVDGLGNWNVTPDSLGPKVIHNLVITRHLLQLIPEDVEEGVRPVCGLAPGVLGLTGIETGEIILGVIDRVKPDLLVAVDALAARSIERVCTTIQLSDSGIHPGSGVGNNRLGITREVLGIPVIAVGVPTVVEGATIALDTIELLLERLRGSGAAFDLKAIQGFDRRERDLLIREVLSPYSANLVVTPKEIDTLIEEVSTLIAGGLNAAFHPSIDPENLAMYTN